MQQAALRNADFASSGLSSARGKQKKLKTPNWKSEVPIDAESLQVRRQCFWETQPAYGGDQVIWDALKAAVEATDEDHALIVLESAGITYTNHSLQVCYDERGSKYELPDYVLSDPTNLSHSKVQSASPELELMNRDQS
ncbi:hypothetical protein WJX73_006754 [Symbiochloris irregularis]|uniref:DC-UbP/UBTD2 N-terminal domain-containing protein n=1 Tax=Symbiochloris irregularis TaxID=706552 RepID=A0AAW1NXH4_9CHLO